MGEFLKSGFSQHLKRQGLSPRTIDLYSGLFDKVDKHFEDLPRVESPDMMEMLKFQKAVNHRAADFLVAHRRMYYWSVLKYYCELKYDLLITIPRNFEEPDIIHKNLGDYKQIVEAIDSILPRTTEQNRIIFTLYRFYGKRISEILGLKVSKINFSENTIEWELKRNKRSTKNMPEDISKLLKDWIRKNELLGGQDLFYPCHIDSKMKAKSKYNRFVRSLKRIENCPEALQLSRTHDIRRAIATQLCLQEGVELANAWLDHSSMDTTLRYKGEIAKAQSNRRAFNVMNKVSRGIDIIVPESGDA